MQISALIIGILVGLSVICALFAVFAGIAAFFCYSKIVGFENSTHQVQYVDPYDKDGEEVTMPGEKEEEFDPFKGTPLDVQDNARKEREENKAQRKYEKEAAKAFGYTEVDEQI